MKRFATVAIAALIGTTSATGHALLSILLPKQEHCADLHTCEECYSYGCNMVDDKCTGEITPVTDMNELINGQNMCKDTLGLCNTVVNPVLASKAKDATEVEKYENFAIGYKKGTETKTIPAGYACHVNIQMSQYTPIFHHKQVVNDAQSKVFIREMYKETTVTGQVKKDEDKTRLTGSQLFYEGLTKNKLNMYFGKKHDYQISIMWINTKTGKNDPTFQIDVIKASGTDYAELWAKANPGSATLIIIIVVLVLIGCIACIVYAIKTGVFGNKEEASHEEPLHPNQADVHHGEM